MSARNAIIFRIQNWYLSSVILTFSQKCFWDCWILVYCRFESYFTFIKKKELLFSKIVAHKKVHCSFLGYLSILLIKFWNVLQSIEIVILKQFQIYNKSYLSFPLINSLSSPYHSLDWRRNLPFSWFIVKQSSWYSEHCQISQVERLQK